MKLNAIKNSVVNEKKAKEAVIKLTKWFKFIAKNKIKLKMCIQKQLTKLKLFTNKR